MIGDKRYSNRPLFKTVALRQAALVNVNSLLHNLHHHQNTDKLKAALNQKNSKGESVFIQAARYGFVDAVQNLIEVGADVQELNSAGSSSLMIAAQNGHDGVVKLLVDALKDNLPDTELKAALNQKGPEGVTALWAAAQNGHENVLELLLGELNKFDTTTNKSELKAALNQKGPGGVTALWIAAQNGHENVVEKFLANGANVQQLDSKKRSPLLMAALNGHDGVVKLLLDALNKLNTTADKFEFKAALNQKSQNGITALMIAAQNGHDGVVKLLVDALKDNLPDTELKAALKQKGPKGVTALWAAAQQGHKDIVEFLLANGADVESSIRERISSLMIAANNRYTEVVRLLVDEFKKLSSAELTAALNQEGPDQEGPGVEIVLWIAAQNGCYDVVKKLIEAGADVLKLNSEGASSLMAAAEQGHTKVVQLLVDTLNKRDRIDNKSELKAALNQQYSNGETALWVAAQNGHVGVVEVLIEAGADVNQALITDKVSPLWIAASNGYEGVVQALINAGADVNQARITDKVSPLGIAACYGYEKVVEKLLAAGVSPEQSVSDGNGNQASTLWIAAQEGHTGVVEALLSKLEGPNLSAALNPKGKKGTVLDHAAYMGKKEVVNLLLEAGVYTKFTLKFNEIITRELKNEIEQLLKDVKPAQKEAEKLIKCLTPSEGRWSVRTKSTKGVADLQYKEHPSFRGIIKRKVAELEAALPVSGLEDAAGSASSVTETTLLFGAEGGSPQQTMIERLQEILNSSEV